MDKQERARMLRHSLVEVRTVKDCMAACSLSFFTLMPNYFLSFLYLTAVVHDARRILNESLMCKTVVARSGT
jgi:hypothetical protein